MRFVNGLAAGMVMACAAIASAEISTRVCFMTPDQETGVVVSNGFGCGRFVLDTTANTLSYRIVVGNLGSAETAAHIHGAADPGVNAGVLHTLPAGPVKVGVWNYAEAQEADILAGKMYVNVHTATNPGGEVRGQIMTHVAFLDGAQDSVATPAKGFALFNINRATDTLSYYIKYAGLSSSEVAAHIHGTGVHTVSTGVVHTLPAGSPKIGSWTYPAAMEQDVVDGHFYVNIHTSTNPGGEIRGQIVSTIAPMDPTQETSLPSPSSAVGCGLCSLNRAGNVMGYDVMRTALSSTETANHIHGFSAAGVNSGVKIALSSVGTTRKLGTWSYGGVQSEEDNILAGLTYFNCHSSLNPGGEIRGQINWAILNEPLPPGCAADIDDDGDFTNGMNPDGGVDINDLLAFLAAFEAGDVAADLDDDGDPTVGNPDGGTDINDLLFFLAHFEAGC